MSQTHKSSCILADGVDVTRGLTCDLLRSRSLKRLIGDVCWAGKKVIDKTLNYSGEVAILMVENDRVIRWQEVFPDCANPGEIPDHLDDFRQRGFPKARWVKVVVVAGNHLSPEGDAPTFVRLGLRMLDQRGEAAG